MLNLAFSITCRQIICAGEEVTGMLIKELIFLLEIKVYKKTSVITEDVQQNCYSIRLFLLMCFLYLPTSFLLSFQSLDQTFKIWLNLILVNGYLTFSLALALKTRDHENRGKCSKCV